MWVNCVDKHQSACRDLVCATQTALVWEPGWLVLCPGWASLSCVQPIFELAPFLLSSSTFTESIVSVKYFLHLFGSYQPISLLPLFADSLSVLWPIFKIFPNSLIANFLSCPEANSQGDLVANFQSGPLAGCQTPPASPSPTCALGSQTLLHDSQLRWGWWANGYVEEEDCSDDEGDVDDDAQLLNERESLLWLFNLFNWRAQPLRLISPFHCHSL